jgi:FkbM family methyltransferase
MKNQDSVIQRGVGKGLRFNPGNSVVSYLLGTAEEPLQRMLQLWLTPGMTVYDVGANVGFLTMIAAELVGDQGMVYAFEPVPALAAQAAHNAELNQFQHVTVYRSALSHSDGNAPFQLSDDVTQGTLSSHAEHRSTKQLVVKTQKLDTLFETDRLRTPDLIKIDVEGAEADVLDGGIQVLRRVRPRLLIELHSTNDAVADRLEASAYVSKVLGSDSSIRNAPAHVSVAAVP